MYLHGEAHSTMMLINEVIRVLSPNFLLTLTRKAFITFPNGALAHPRVRVSFNKLMYNLRSIHD